MTPPEVKAAAAELVERTTRAQGLPLHVDDPTTLQRVAAIVYTRRGGGRRARAA